MNAVELLFSLRGRVSRPIYWVTLTPLLLAAAYGWLLSGDPDYRIETIGLILGIATVWPLVAIHVKRWHDRGRSGWWLLIILVPVLGQVWTLIECGLLRGNAGDNEYGPPNPEVRDLFSVSGRQEKTRTRSRESRPEAKDEPAGPRFIADDMASLMKLAGLVIRSDPRAFGAKVERIRSYVGGFAGIQGAGLVEAIETVRGARFSTDSPTLLARKFKDVHARNGEVLHAAADFLFEIAIEDGSLSGEEEVLLSRVHDVFGFKGAQYSELRSSDERRKQDDRQEQRPPRQERTNKDRFYGQVLGLEGKITKRQIRSAYRDLVKQYHPDRVAHLGPKLKETADREMKLINEAWEYFEKKYDL